MKVINDFKEYEILDMANGQKLYFIEARSSNNME